MVLVDASALAAALTAEAPTPHARWLGPADEPALQELLRARYGETYSYRELYAEGGLTALWRSGTLLSLGEYDDEGVLVAHTGLLLRPGRDHVESAMSLVHPGRRSAMSRDEHTRMWTYVLTKLKAHVAFLHQHTTTLHRGAQLYAERMMHAVPIGLVIDYTAGETLIGIDARTGPMQALAMTTVLRPRPAPLIRYLPAGPWFEWLQARFAALDDAPALGVRLAPPVGQILFGASDYNPALELMRRWVLAVDEEPLDEALDELEEPGPGPVRVDLVHVPVDVPSRVASASALLQADGFVPVGVRPGEDSDSIVWQRLPDRAAAAAAAGQAVLAGNAARELFSTWTARCAPTP